MFQLNLEGTKVRRQLPIGELPNDVDSRTVYVVKKKSSGVSLICLLFT